MCTAVPARDARTGVLFDRDETIAYTDTGVYREVALWAPASTGWTARGRAGAAGAVGAQEDPAQVGGWWGLRSEADEAAYWERYAQELAARLDLPAERLGLLLQEWPYERYMKAYPAARGVLEALRARGVKVGVLSNTLPSIGVTLDAIGLSDVVDVAIASCSLGVHKPERDAYLRSADLMELPVQEILFVDDKLENVTAAREAGMRAALIDLRHGTPGALHDLRDVLELV